MKTIKKILFCAMLAMGCAAAFAATITITDPGCATFSAAKSGADLVITCGTTTPTPPPVPTPVPVPVPPPVTGCPAATTINFVDTSYTWDQSLTTISNPQQIDTGHSIAFKFTAGASGSGSFSTVELPYLLANNRYATITKCPGDFTSVTPDNSYCAVDGTGLSANVRFSVGVSYRNYCTLQAGQTYYFNIRHGIRDRTTGAIVDSAAPGTYGFLLQMLHN